MSDSYLARLEQALENKASTKIITLSADAQRVEHYLSSQKEFFQTLRVYDSLKHFWPLAPVLSYEVSQLKITMKFSGLPLNQDKTPAFLKAADLAMLEIPCENNFDFLPFFNEGVVRDELELYYQWFLAKVLKISTQEYKEEFYHAFVRYVQKAPLKVTHRDFHSENLLALGPSELFLVDYQDALWAPYNYDFVSLMEDPYFDKTSYTQISFQRFYEKAGQYSQNPQLDYQIMALQRVMKMVGIFSRLAYRDKKKRYMNFVATLLNRLYHLAWEENHKVFFKKHLMLFLNQNPDKKIMFK